MEFTNYDLKSFTKKICELDIHIMPCVVKKQLLRESMDTIIDYVGNDFELQNAVMMLTALCDRKLCHTIYKNCVSRNECDYYESLLCLMFDSVVRLENNDFSIRYLLSKPNDVAIRVYNNLKKLNKVNDYIKMYECHIKNKKDDGQYMLYRVRCSDYVDTNNPYLKQYIGLSLNNLYLTIGVCGFTLNEINSNSMLRQLISCFKDTYILFCDGFSSGMYVFK